jgi:hypothetical protein
MTGEGYLVDIPIQPRRPCGPYAPTPSRNCDKYRNTAQRNVRATGPLRHPKRAADADSIMGVTFYADDAPEEFGKFDRALITMYRLTAGDTWVSPGELSRAVSLHLWDRPCPFRSLPFRSPSSLCTAGDTPATLESRSAAVSLTPWSSSPCTVSLHILCLFRTPHPPLTSFALFLPSGISPLYSLSRSFFPVPPAGRRPARAPGGRDGERGGGLLHHQVCQTYNNA